MTGPACPSCNARLLLRGTRQHRKTTDIEGKKWYQLAGYRSYCPRCGVRLRSLRSGYFWVALFSLVIANGLGAHRAIFEAWGYAGVALYYFGWTAMVIALAARVRYVRLPGRWS